jgi:hypothetical protein
MPRMSYTIDERNPERQQLLAAEADESSVVVKFPDMWAIARR